MKQEPSEREELIQWILLNYKLVAVALLILAKIAVSMVYFLEALGAPRWAAVVGVASIPIISWFAVSRSNRGPTITSLSLSNHDDNHDDQDPTSKDDSPGGVSRLWRFAPSRSSALGTDESAPGKAGASRHKDDPQTLSRRAR